VDVGRQASVVRSKLVRGIITARRSWFWDATGLIINLVTVDAQTRQLVRWSTRDSGFIIANVL